MSFDDAYIRPTASVGGKFARVPIELPNADGVLEPTFHRYLLGGMKKWRVRLYRPWVWLETALDGGNVYRTMQPLQFSVSLVPEGRPDDVLTAWGSLVTRNRPLHRNKAKVDWPALKTELVPVEFILSSPHRKNMWTSGCHAMC